MAYTNCLFFSFDFLLSFYDCQYHKSMFFVHVSLCKLTHPLLLLWLTVGLLEAAGWALCPFGGTVIPEAERDVRDEPSTGVWAEQGSLRAVEK